MQKLFNFMAVCSFSVTTSLLVVIVTVFVNKDKYVQQVQNTVLEEVANVLPELVQSSLNTGLDVESPLGNMNGGPSF